MASKPTFDFNKKFEDNEMVENKVDPREAMLKQLRAESAATPEKASKEEKPAKETKEPKEVKPAKSVKKEAEAYFGGGKEDATFRITLRMPDDLAKFVDKLHKDYHLSKNDVILRCIELTKNQLEG